MMKEKKHPGGRPSKYKKEYCKSLIDFFTREAYKSEKLLVTYKDGHTEEKYTEVPCDLPLFEKFAISIGVHRETLLNWCDKYPEFFDSYKRAKDLQLEILVINGLRNNYAQPFAIFTAKNAIGWRDKQENINFNTDSDEKFMEMQKKLRDEINNGKI